MWEEYKLGMWKNIHGEKRNELLRKAIQFTGNAKLYGEYMIRVIREWPISCEQNLMITGLNRQAWIGHAACCIAFQCPEEITRLAWHFLSNKQQIKANKKADYAIELWEKYYFNQQKSNQLELFHYA